MRLFPPTHASHCQAGTCHPARPGLAACLACLPACLPMDLVSPCKRWCGWVQVMDNLGSYTGEVQSQVAQQLAQQIGVQPQQVALTTPNFPVSSQVVVAGARGGGGGGLSSSLRSGGAAGVVLHCMCAPRCG